MVQWVADAAKQSEHLSDVLISSDDDNMMQPGCEFGYRPNALCTDDSPIIDTIKYHVDEFVDAVALLQPTSPFVTPEIIDLCIWELMVSPNANSIQTIAKMPHNHHAYNQRELKNGRVSFLLPFSRAECYNKQLKPPLYVFGNLVVTRVSALDQGVFAEPSIGIEIPPEEAIDIDTQQDLDLANKIYYAS